MIDYIVPLLLLVVSILSLGKKEKPYDLLLEGAAEGLKLMVTLIPTLIILMTSVTMLRASGALDWFSGICAPLFSRFGIPPETAPLILIRPFSGSAALAVGAELMGEYGPDSLIGRTAAIMLGSTETTFYAVSIYFGSAGIQKTRYTIPAALIADFIGFFMASFTAKYL